MTEHAANGNKEPTKVTAEPRVGGYGSTEAAEGSPPLAEHTGHHWPLVHTGTHWHTHIGALYCIALPHWRILAHTVGTDPLQALMHTGPASWLHQAWHACHEGEGASIAARLVFSHHRVVIPV